MKKTQTMKRENLEVNGDKGVLKRIVRMERYQMKVCELQQLTLNGATKRKIGFGQVQVNRLFKK